MDFILGFERSRSCIPASIKSNLSRQTLLQKSSIIPKTLTTIPPELLLTTISHLPSASSLKALSQTSRSLANFLNTHAASICNTFIQQDYAHAAEILESDYIDGWLVPKHLCIFEAEEKWIRENQSRASSLLSKQLCERVLSFNNCCFRTSSYSSDDNLQSLRLLRNCQHLRYSSNTSTPNHENHAPIVHYNTHHQNLSLTHSLGLPLKLSRPGPQYLSFMEQHSGEIVTRWIMDGHTRDAEAGEVAEARKKGNFDFMVGNYCIRKWLLKCNDAFVDYDVYDTIPESEIVRVHKFGLRKKLRNWKSQGSQAMEAIKHRMRKREKTPPRPLIFGEIESDEEKSGPMIEKDTWVEGLLWYYGISGQLATTSLPTEMQRTRKIQKIRRGAKHIKEKIKDKTRELRPKCSNIWRSVRCEKGFEVLED